MGTSAGAASFAIDPFADLDDVFLHFYGKLGPIQQTLRSVAEARISGQELRQLIQWFSDLRKKPRMWCDDPWQKRIGSIGTASDQEMFGALLIILASEICRESASEEEVWPAVTSVLAADKLSFPLLFDANRQPMSLCKKAMAEGARRLNLRNLIDCSGRQEYADTLRLQFGFTIRGARRRLPEWLAGLGRPVAVRMLCGDEPGFEHLQSASFTTLWKTLEDFRKRRVDLEFASAMLQTSPWIRGEWAEEILRIIEVSRNRVFSTPAVSPSVAFPERAREPVCEIALHWDAGAKPRFRIQLSDERMCEILGPCRKAQFAVDGAIVGTWVALENGEWRGERQLPCEPRSGPPNLRPGLLTISGDSELKEEVDLAELGINDTLAIFDLKTGRLLSPSSRLDPARDYAFICDTDLSLPGATREGRTKNRCAYAVTGPWDRALRLTCDGLTYWKPVIGDTEPPPQLNVALLTPPSSFAVPGSFSRVLVAGVPDDARGVTLTVGQSIYAVVSKAGIWETEVPVRITSAMALKSERLRVRIEGYPRVVVPTVAVKLRGIASMESGANAEDELQWEFLNRDRPLNRAGGSGSAKMFVDEPAAWLFEGEYRVGKIGTRPFPLRDLHGWGAPLVVRGEEGARFEMIRSVEDQGAGRFQAPMFRGRCESAFHWRAPVSPGRDHRILMWSDLLRDPRILTTDQVDSQKDGLVWKLRDSDPVAAMAISHQGARNASFWTVERVIHALKAGPSVKLFALLRWLHLPVLNGDYSPHMLQAVLKAPAEFVTGWLQDASLPFGLVHRLGEPGLRTVVRSFLWNYVEKSESRIERIATAFQDGAPDASQGESEQFKNSLLRMGFVCPSLAYSLALKKVRGDKYKRYVRSVAASMLGVAEGADTEFLRNRMAADRRETGGRVGMAADVLETAEAAFAAHLDNPAISYRQFEPALRQLGETSRGPQYLTASLLMRLADRSRF